MDTLASRVMARCDELARFSETEGELTRTFLSEPMKDLHRELGNWMESAGMSVRVDAAGNIIGRLAANDPHARALLIGSHLDTVRNAGKYDGALGVLSGLALAEGLGGEAPPFHIDVIGFSEEEGVRFGVPFIGSRAITGTLSEDLLQLTDSEGISVREAIRAFGLDPAELPRAVYDPAEVLGFVEIHSEQGPRLAAANAAVGVVSAIAGTSRARIRFTGRAGHAGTTPMDLRRDALTGAADFVLEVERRARETPELVGTVGQLQIRPGAGNVIPGEATLSLDLRHIDDRVRHAALASLKNEATGLANRRELELAWHDLMDQPAVAMDRELSERLKRSAGAVPVVPSGAGHDAMIVGSFLPSAMLFVRSPNGISHHPDELVLEQDVAVALRVLTSFVTTLAAA